MEGGKLHHDDLHDLSPYQKYSVDQIRENAMSTARDTFGVEKGSMLSFGEEMKKRDHLEDQALDGRII